MLEPQTSNFHRTYDLTKARQSPSHKQPEAHQSAALGKLSEWFERTSNPEVGGILVLPTGGGKTYTAVRFLRERDFQKLQSPVVGTHASFAGAGTRQFQGDYGHQTNNHSVGNYVNGSIHTNTVESFWNLMSRSIYHQVSAKHIHRYCSEFDYRHNTRKSGETSRFDSALAYTDGRLMYKVLTANQ